MKVSKESIEDWDKILKAETTFKGQTLGEFAEVYFNGLGKEKGAVNRKKGKE